VGGRVSSLAAAKDSSRAPSGEHQKTTAALGRGAKGGSRQKRRGEENRGRGKTDDMETEYEENTPVVEETHSIDYTAKFSVNKKAPRPARTKTARQWIRKAAISSSVDTEIARLHGIIDAKQDLINDLKESAREHKSPDEKPKPTVDSKAEDRKRHPESCSPKTRDYKEVQYTTLVKIDRPALGLAFLFSAILFVLASALFYFDTKDHTNDCIIREYHAWNLRTRDGKFVEVGDNWDWEVAEMGCAMSHPNVTLFDNFYNVSLIYLTSFLLLLFGSQIGVQSFIKLGYPKVVTDITGDMRADIEAVMDLRHKEVVICNVEAGYTYSLFPTLVDTNNVMNSQPLFPVYWTTVFKGIADEEVLSQLLCHSVGSLGSDGKTRWAKINQVAKTLHTANYDRMAYRYGQLTRQNTTLAAKIVFDCFFSRYDATGFLEVLV
jgi:hypothetical protein